VILADEDFRLGGRLNADSDEVDGQGGADWADGVLGELAAMPHVRVMPRTTVYGAYDHGIYGALERKTDHLAASGGKPRQVLWRLYSKHAVLAAGATERGIAFGNNDRPGIMLAGSVRTYVNRFGVTPGQRVAVFANNSDGARTSEALTRAGVHVAKVIDTRAGDVVVDAHGRRALTAISLNGSRRVQVDCLAVAGGWSPNVHLTCHQRGRPTWRDDIAGFVPGGDLPVGMSVAGAANGEMTLAAALKSGHAAANTAIKELGLTPTRKQAPKASDEPAQIISFWHVTGTKRAWVDLQNDVTVKDIKQSQQEGFRSVEHLKRYTTLGMATDQGKTSNVLGLAIMAEATGKTIPETGTTIFRPPYSPVPIAAGE
jgi:sarcosine oxidase subunit alpha